MSRALELRYKFRKLSEEYSDQYMLRELLAYLTENQLETYYEEFNRLHPGPYDKDGNEL